MKPRTMSYHDDQELSALTTTDFPLNGFNTFITTPHSSYSASSLYLLTPPHSNADTITPPYNRNEYFGPVGKVDILSTAVPDTRVATPPSSDDDAIDKEKGHKKTKKKRFTSP
jgi:hypothetical protein